MVKVDKKKFIAKLKKKLLERKLEAEVISALLYPSDDIIQEEFQNLKSNIRK